MSELKSILIGGIFLFLFLSSAYYTSVSFSSTYSSSVDNDLANLWGNSSDRYERTKSILGEVDNKTRSSKTIFGESEVAQDSALTAIFTNAYSALLIMGDTFSLATGTVMDLGSIIGLPGWAVIAISLMLLVIILIALISAIHKYKV